MKSYLLRMSDEQYARAEAIAEKKGMTLKAVFLRGLEEPETEMRVLRAAVERLRGGEDALAQAEKIVRDGNW